MDSFGVVNVIKKLADPIWCVRAVLILTEINLFLFERMKDALDKSVLGRKPRRLRRSQQRGLGNGIRRFCHAEAALPVESSGVVLGSRGAKGLLQ